MDATSLLQLLNFYNNFDMFLLVLVRLLAFFLILPVLSGQNMPMTAKVSFAFVCSLLIVSSGKVGVVDYGDSAGEYVYLILQEFLAGFILGFAVYLIFTLIYFAGQLIDFQIGFSMVSVFDPLTQIQAPVVGNLFFMTVCVVLVQTGGFNSFLAAIFFSYEKLPIGGAQVLGNANLARIAMDMIASFMDIAVRVSLPIVGSLFIIDVAMGLLVKAAPQMNIFVVGVPIKVLVGLALLIVLMPLINTIYSLVFERSMGGLMSMLKGMSP